MAKIKIRCPSCSKFGSIEIPDNVIKEVSRGIVTINLGKNQICEHSFIAYLDRNFEIRDCFLTDFQIELPEMEVERKTKEVDIPNSDKLDVDLIKINFYAYTFVYLLRSCILNKRTIILIDEDFLKEHVIHFLKFIFEHSFQTDVNIEKSENYKQNKKNFKDYLVFDKQGMIFHDKEKLLAQKGIKIEKMIIQKFLSEVEPKTSLIVFRNEIQKAFELSKSLSTRIEEFKKNNVVDQVDAKKLFENLIEGQNIKISLVYTRFLIEIVENYFKTEIPMVWKFFLYRV